MSLICSKNSLESDEPTQVHSKKRLKPLIPVSRRNLKRSDPLNESQKKIQEPSDLLPSPSGVVNTRSENISSSATQVCDNSLSYCLYRMGWISDSTRKTMDDNCYFHSGVRNYCRAAPIHLLPSYPTILEEDEVLN